MKNAYIATAVALAFAAIVQPALALGSVDPVTATTNFGAWFFLFITAVFPIVSAYKGIHAAMNGEHFGRHVAALLGGLVLCVGGFTVMNRFA